ncbi:UNVERIFIED_CONTAM: hypothetical protein Slati_3468600 [Sesamum latifolium]|uniref:Uncharacterized protein n=1 Tax=Sesamum latifolium TaxID=2727402 RepID=A0AAW2UHD6_9LAMI
MDKAARRSRAQWPARWRDRQPRARRVRAHQVAGHELAGCELTSSPGRELAARWGWRRMVTVLRRKGLT